MIRPSVASLAIIFLVGCSSGANSCPAPRVVDLPSSIRVGQTETVHMEHLLAECRDTGNGAPAPRRGTVEIELVTDANNAQPIATFSTTEVSSEAKATLTVEVPLDAPTGPASLVLDGMAIASFTINGS